MDPHTVMDALGTVVLALCLIFHGLRADLAETRSAIAELRATTVRHETALTIAGLFGG